MSWKKDPSINESGRRDGYLPVLDIPQKSVLDTGAATRNYVEEEQVPPPPESLLSESFFPESGSYC